MRYLTKCWIFGFLLICLISYAVFMYHVIIMKNYVDFMLFYHFAKNFILSHDLYAAIPWHQYNFPKAFISNIHDFQQLSLRQINLNFNANLNPPSFVFFIFPFGWLSYEMAFSLWTVLTFTLSAASIYLLYRKIFYAQKRWMGYFILLGIFLGSVIGFANISLGQLGVICFFCILLIWHFARIDQELPAGILLGILLSDKYSFGLLALLFLLQKRWCIFFSALGVFLLLNGCAYLVVGKASFMRYWYVLHQIDWYQSNWNASLLGFISRMTNIDDVKLFNSAWFGQAFYYLTSFILLVQLFKLSCRRLLTQQDFDYVFCYALIIGFIICPLSWLYYFAILFLPISLLVRYLAAEGKTSLPQEIWIIFCLGLLFYPGTLDIRPDHSLIQGLGQDSFHFYGLILFFGLWCYFEKGLRNSKLIQASEKNLLPWVLLSYLIVTPSLIFLFYLVFISASKIWI